MSYVALPLDRPIRLTLDGDEKRKQEADARGIAYQVSGFTFRHPSEDSVAAFRDLYRTHRALASLNFVRENLQSIDPFFDVEGNEVKYEPGKPLRVGQDEIYELARKLSERADPPDPFSKLPERPPT